MSGSLVAVLLLSLGIGAVDIAPDQVAAIMAKRLFGLDLGIGFSVQQELVLWNIRLPRILLGLLAGGGLSLAGAGLQGIFRNPLADPGLIGSSSGAAVGAVAMIMLGLAPLGSFSLPSAAFFGRSGSHLPGLRHVASRRSYRGGHADPYRRGA
jgi:iron complex transport system permease protein